MTNRLKAGSAVASLCAAILLGGCAWQSDLDASEAKNKSLEEQVAAQQQQIASLTAQNAAESAQVARLQGAIKYTVNSDLLFPSGGWKMNASGQQVIAKLAAKLAPSQQNKLVVNGYTDNTPIGPELQAQGIATNQDLSQKRAENVMEYIISQGVKPELISAVGHGEQNPVAPNDNAQDRAKNRRVELTLAGPAM
jgi:chemotaxis protein MotB